MDYFSKYKRCKDYYSVYNVFLSCREYLKYCESSNTILSKNYELDNLYHNIKGPALITKFDNIYHERYYINGLYDRKNGPANIIYQDNYKFIEIYFFKNKKHRVNNPAEIQYYPNGNIWREYYWINDVRCNDNGPVYNEYSIDGELLATNYW